MCSHFKININFLTVHALEYYSKGSDSHFYPKLNQKTLQKLGTCKVFSKFVVGLSWIIWFTSFYLHKYNLRKINWAHVNFKLILNLTKNLALTVPKPRILLLNWEKTLFEMFSKTIRERDIFGKIILTKTDKAKDVILLRVGAHSPYYSWREKISCIWN